MYLSNETNEQLYKDIILIFHLTFREYSVYLLKL